MVDVTAWPADGGFRISDANAATLTAQDYLKEMQLKMKEFVLSLNITL